MIISLEEPENVNVSPVLNVSFDPLSPEIVNDEDEEGENDKFPDPSVTKTSPLEPSVLGNVNVIEDGTFVDAARPTKFVPFDVASKTFTEPPEDEVSLFQYLPLPMSLFPSALPMYSS